MFSKKKKQRGPSEDVVESLASIGIDFIKGNEKPDITISGKDLKPDIIIQVKESKLKGILGYTALTIVIIVLVFSITMLLQNNIVNCPVEGAEYTFGNISIVSKFYKVSTRSLSPGDIILYIDKNSKGEYEKTGIMGLVFNYKIGEVKSITNDWEIYIYEQEPRIERRISTEDILYIKSIPEG